MLILELTWADYTVRKKDFLYMTALVCAVTAVYAGHFHNSFHFDDSHTIQGNDLIRSLANIPRFFSDGSTFSFIPQNQQYRPVVTASLAFDYWLAGGLDPLVFHLSTYFWFIVQLWLMYMLYCQILRDVYPQQDFRLVALFAVALYGLHPANAETINYIIQRGELYSTLGVIAGLVGYRTQFLRRTGLYLVPVAVGILAKPPAVMFAPILFFYLLLFGQGGPSVPCHGTNRWHRFFSAVRSSGAAFVVCFLLYLLQRNLTPASYTPGGGSLYRYIITQPFVCLHYFLSFFMPVALSVDSDWTPFGNIEDVRVWLGFLFVAFLLVVAVRASSRKPTLPISFGVLWFLISLLPTSAVPLAEVMNDHRMFFPFVGLTLGVSSLGIWLTQTWPFRVSRSTITICALIAIATLPLYAGATLERNRVWQSEETLWQDAAVKSPKNPRALMYYGVILLEKNQVAKAYEYLSRAWFLKPDSTEIEVNLGIASGLLGRGPEAERHYKSAVRLSPDSSMPYFFYGRWLHSEGRQDEAIVQLQKAIEKYTRTFEARYLLMQIYSDTGNQEKLHELALSTIRLSPKDPRTIAFLSKQGLDRGLGAIGAEAAPVEEIPTH